MINRQSSTTAPLHQRRFVGELACKIVAQGGLAFVVGKLPLACQPSRRRVSGAIYYPRVMSWIEAVAQTRAGLDPNLNLKPIRFRSQRTPLTITGNSGAGKSKLWSILTGRKYHEQSSLTVDEAYMLRRNNRAFTLTTIPGQTSNGRYAGLQFYFRESGVLDGVIFIASNGFDTIWPDSRITVAPQIRPYNIAGLRKRNKQKERDRFQEVCGMLAERLVTRNAHRPPKWMLVLVNKADLYWSDLDDAERYYLPGSGSAFDKVAQEMMAEVGGAARLSYDVLPLATEPQNFVFQSAKGILRAPTELTDAQCRASIGCVVQALEERCDR
jgi:hypothetical protein